MIIEQNLNTGIPHLGVYTISEDLVLETASSSLWEILSSSLGLRPSQWLDSQGDRMYAAIMYSKTTFDLDKPILEDASIKIRTEVIAVRKPHSLCVCTFHKDGHQVASCTLLSSFIKRKVKGSNKKFSKVRDLWKEDDFNINQIDEILDRHHQVKSTDDLGTVVHSTTANRMTDFNTADFMYFKNYTLKANAAEWDFGRKGPTKMNKLREVFYYGNVDDGMSFDLKVAETEANKYQTSIITEDGRRIYLSFAEMQEVDIPMR